MKRTVLVFGLIAGLVVSAFMAISMAIASNMEGSHGAGSMLVGYASMLIAFSFVFVGIKSYRDKHLDGSITFGKGFLTGFLIAFIASTLYVITWALEYNFFLTDFMDQYAQSMIDQAVAAGSTPEQIAVLQQEMQEGKAMYASPVGFTLITYMEILPLGVIVALISALILKKKPQ
ncbi:MAG: hypothetical protein RL007_2637 [Bacteroidota bacterium]|jgi:hypothetical protein